jgi:hypothetical protein
MSVVLPVRSGMKLPASSKRPAVGFIPEPQHVPGRLGDSKD